MPAARSSWPSGPTPTAATPTTLLNGLSGLDDIDAGTVTVDGYDLFAMSDADRTRHRASRWGSSSSRSTSSRWHRPPAVRTRRVPAVMSFRAVGAGHAEGLAGELGRRPHSVITILPRTWPSSSRRIAAAASASGYVRSIAELT
jgi:hypothetical protein